MIEQMINHVEKVIRITLQLDDDVVLQPDSDLVNEIGLDSIEAFEAVATLHELMGVRIPDDLDPKALATIAKISQYLVGTYDADTIQTFAQMDIAAKLAEMDTSSELS